MRATFLLLAAAVLLAFGYLCPTAAADRPDGALRTKAEAALAKAVGYYRGRVASHGGYVYYYTLDLTERWGEGKAGPDTIFVQPPGTPTVGLAYLRAFEGTGDKQYLAAAQETAEALVAGQLKSGGWSQTITFGKGPPQGKTREARSSLDDGQTQTALQFLMQADRALGFKHAGIHGAVEYGLKGLIGAQFANGGFPQGWIEPATPQPVKAAAYPAYDWKTEGRLKNYWDYYTLNDGLASTVAETLTQAHEIYGDTRALAALKKLGDFLILAQMPEPQPGWCQQYNYDMIPIWARKFEPPAITGSESQGVMETLIRIAQLTGEKKYLAPVPKALAYYRRSLLPGGQLARFYELQTNQPLYMTKDYQLTYSDAAVPSHYGWKVSAKLDQVEKLLREAEAGPRPTRPRGAPGAAEIERIIAGLDEQGRWITTHGSDKLVGQPPFVPGFRYLSSAVFARNVESLARYLGAIR